MSDLLYSIRRKWLALTNPLRKTYTAQCDHKTKLRKEVSSLGDTFIRTLQLQENGRPAYCHDCLNKMSIQCAWCGEGIHVGNSITLNLALDERFPPKSYAIRDPQDPRCVVGCLRWECCDTGLAREGLWVAPGKIQRTGSNAALLLSGTVEAVIVSDLNDPFDFGIAIKFKTET